MLDEMLIPKFLLGAELQTPRKLAFGMACSEY